MPITEDELDDGNKVVIKEVVENYIIRLTEEYEMMGYSEEARAQEDWEADAADMMEETSD